MPVDARTVAAAQAAYLAVTGTWPILSYRSFEWMTGRKREPWLVKTVGALTFAVAAALGSHATSTRPDAARPLGTLTATAFGLVDVWYAGVRRRISPIYLLDAAAELAFVIAWLRAADGTLVDEPPMHGHSA